MWSFNMCDHAACLPCLAELRSFNLTPPCPICRKAWQATNEEEQAFDELCRASGCEMWRFAMQSSTTDTQASQLLVPNAPQWIIPLCCNRVAARIDRRMEWFPIRQNDRYTYNWHCYGCGRTVSLVQLQDFISSDLDDGMPVCQFGHGPVSAVIDLGWNGMCELVCAGQSPPDQNGVVGTPTIIRCPSRLITWPSSLPDRGDTNWTDRPRDHGMLVDAVVEVDASPVVVGADQLELGGGEHMEEDDTTVRRSIVDTMMRLVNEVEAEEEMAIIDRIINDAM
jgi:hypothetical protein